jgi:hypothetical protein
MTWSQRGRPTRSGICSSHSTHSSFLSSPILLDRGGFVTIRWRADDYTGKAPAHCHIFAHSDTGKGERKRVREGRRAGGREGGREGGWEERKNWNFAHGVRASVSSYLQG